ncbi:acetyl esterase/lipase [Blastococcus colisei]|uniref:Acetyl esterase/lipase n=1 Tax=Blastococcus colisei TaxID=1564162 RepID=A0A543P0A5_9ACTN|nr:alpha/beta hydrolase [Blastococcus colisei]TQN37539.1 acetyl esterase/lipase [Blastococcus colisei]
MNRRPQVPVRAMRAGVRALVRPVLGPRVPVGIQRRWLHMVTRPTPLAEGVTIRSGRLGRRPAETLVPADGDPGTALLYLHGGGFTTGSPATHRALATHLAAASGATAHVLDYRLAPEHPFPAALDDVLAAYRELLDRGVTPARTALAGDSAGGWLALTAALRLRDAGDPAPAALGLISPWLDLTGSAWPDDRTDAMLRPAWLRRCARDFGSGTDPAELAPLDARLAGLPPITMHVGSEEILLEDAVRLAHRARAAGVPVDLRRLDGMWHVAHASAGLVTASTAAVTALGTALAAHLISASDQRPHAVAD